MDETTPSHVATIRRFNRFYTSRIGVLQDGLLESPFSLTEVRVLFELAHREAPRAKDLAADLGIDAGYLSRILLRFKERRLVTKKPSRNDARQRPLALTPLGTRTFGDLDARAREAVRRMLAKVSGADRPRLIEAMHTIESLLAPGAEPKVPYLLRPHQPGDMGWVVQRHGEIYAQEYGWNERFEGLVAEIVAKFIEHFDPERERSWIAEREGERVGCVFLARKSSTVAQLRLLLVEPSARGLGIGKRLVSECERFARRAGYRKIRLWTQSVLRAARHVYAQAGYRLVSEEPHDSFGADLVAEIWERSL
jgi:DNA-binding MarR family transcriptional regulator/N-acetylglutamate synthase-like GNAT family acetyltransferase